MLMILVYPMTSGMPRAARVIPAMTSVDRLDLLMGSSPSSKGNFREDTEFVFGKEGPSMYTSRIFSDSSFPSFADPRPDSHYACFKPYAGPQKDSALFSTIPASSSVLLPFCQTICRDQP